MASLTGRLLLGEDVAAKVIASAIIFFYLIVLLRDNLFPFKSGGVYTIQPQKCVGVDCGRSNTTTRPTASIQLSS